MLQDILTNPIFAFVILVGLVVFFHEWGHFLVGRALGVAVEEFSIGFGPKAFGFRKGNTEYKICWLPLGGYVRFYGSELGGEVPEHRREESILTTRLYKRALISAAGPAANFVLSFIIMFVLWGIGMPQPSARVAVMPGKAAHEAGLRSGDRIIAVDGRDVRSWKELTDEISVRPGEALSVLVERPGVSDSIQIQVTPEAEQSESPFGEEIQVGRIGVTQFFPSPRLVRVAGGLSEGLGLQTGDEILAVGTKNVQYLHEFFTELGAYYGVSSPQELARSIQSELPKSMPELKVKREDGVHVALGDPEAMRLWASALLASEQRNIEALSEWDHAFVTTDLLIAPSDLTTTESDTPSVEKQNAKENLEACGLTPGHAIIGLGSSAQNVQGVASPVELSIALASLTEGLDASAKTSVKQTFSVINPDGTTALIDCEVPVDVARDHLNRDRLRVMFPIQFLTQGLPAQQVVVRSSSWLLAPVDALEAVKEQSLMIFSGLRKLVTGSIPLANLGGPIQIARVAGSAAEGGLLIFFITVSWMSVNIGMFNLLPLPALDGGALLMQGVEGVYGKPLPLRVQHAVQRLGIALILLLFIVVFYNDILRLLGQ